MHFIGAYFGFPVWITGKKTNANTYENPFFHVIINPMAVEMLSCGKELYQKAKFVICT
jgi:hypothetical protein